MLASASNFNMSVGNIRQPSNAQAYLDKAKKDRLSMLRSQEPDMDKVGEKEGGIGATAAAFKLGDSLSKVKDKVNQGVKAVGEVKDGINRIRNVSANPSTEPVNTGARTEVGTMEDRLNRILGSGGGGGEKPPTRMNVSSMIDGSANNQMDNLTSALGSKANGVLSDARGAVRSTASNLHASVMSSVGGAGEDVEKAIGTGARVASGAMEATAGVLDALGPIGDILGVGLSIFGGVEAKREKATAMDASKTAEAEVAKPVAPQTQQATNVSLDTAKQAPMSSATHY